METRTFIGASVILTWTLVLVRCEPPQGQEAHAGPTLVAVQVGKVTRTTLHAYLNIYGTVVPAPAMQGQPAGAALISAPAAGIVRAVPAREGMRVRSGDLVARLDDRVAQADVERAHARVAFAEQTLDRESLLLEQHNTSRKQFELAQEALALARADLVTAKGLLAQVQLRAPLDGVIARVNVMPGQAVDLNTVVAEIVDLNHLVVAATVPADDAARVRPGQSARLATGTEADIAATVSYVDPTVDPRTGAVTVRLPLAEDSGLPPGAFVSVQITVEERTCLAVPRDSVFVQREGEGTLAVIKDDVAHQLSVRVGLVDRGLIEVASDALQEGATVVTVGAYALPDESRVRIVSDQEGQPRP